MKKYMFVMMFLMACGSAQEEQTVIGTAEGTITTGDIGGKGKGISQIIEYHGHVEAILEDQFLTFTSCKATAPKLDHYEIKVWCVESTPVDYMMIEFYLDDVLTSPSELPEGIEIDLLIQGELE